MSDLVSVYAFAVFLMGNIVVNASDTCHATAPILYRSAVAALVLSWFWSAQIILVALSVLFFLPFLLISMRFFGVGSAKHEVGPLTQQQIDKIPQRIYVGSIPETTPAEPVSSDPEGPPAEPTSNDPASLNPPSPKPNEEFTTSTSTVVAAHSTRKRQFWRLWRRPKRRSTSAFGGGEAGGEVGGDFVPLPKGMEGVRLPESQDACSICLMGEFGCWEGAEISLTCSSSRRVRPTAPNWRRGSERVGS